MISGTTQTETSRTDAEKHQRVSLHFAEPFDAGETLELRIAFHGQLGGGSTGFFAFEYDLVDDGQDGGGDADGHEHRDEGGNGVEDDGEEKIGYAAATHLEVCILAPFAKSTGLKSHAANGGPLGVSLLGRTCLKGHVRDHPSLPC
jgi:hypothetical protein